MSYSLNRMYNALDTTRQAFHSKLNHFMRKQEELEQLSLIMDQFRSDHPGMSLRDAYYVIKPTCIGRDKFESYFQQHGYGVGRKASFIRTTNSHGVIRFPNLISGIKLTGVNQVWVSDITYYLMGESFYYLTFITDLFSRRILGYIASKTLLTEYTTIPAIQMALKERGKTKIPGLIIHSDGGGQYYSKAFGKITKAAGMKNSMGKSVYENPHAERINGIIKNNYLKYYNPGSYSELVKKLKKAVKMYNEQKPHAALKRLSPVEYEEKINIEIQNNFASYFRISTLNHHKQSIFENKFLIQKPVNVI